jgi:hypothetical protein
MSTTTTRLGLYKTASDGSELVNVVTDLLNNLDAIDLNIGYRDCTSSTRPSTVWKGLPIRESDTGRLYVSNGTAPASASWKQIPAEGASFLAAFTYAGAVSLNSTLAVTGATTLGSTLGVTGATTLSSTLAVAGAATLSSNLSVAGSASVTGNTNVGGNLSVTGIGQRLFSIKSANESVTSSTTLQNDDHLSASIGATGTYTFDVFLLVNSGDSAADLKVGFSFPTGTCHFGGTGGHIGAYTTGTSGVGEYFAIASATSGTSFLGYGVSSTAVTWVRLTGTFIATATGTLRVMWAQVASSATATTLLAGSWMRVERNV